MTGFLHGIQAHSHKRALQHAETAKRHSRDGPPPRTAAHWDALEQVAVWIRHPYAHWHMLWMHTLCVRSIGQHTCGCFTQPFSNNHTAISSNEFQWVAVHGQSRKCHYIGSARFMAPVHQCAWSLKVYVQPKVALFSVLDSVRNRCCFFGCRWWDFVDEMRMSSLYTVIDILEKLPKSGWRPEQRYCIQKGEKIGKKRGMETEEENKESVIVMWF